MLKYFEDAFCINMIFFSICPSLYIQLRHCEECTHRPGQTTKSRSPRAFLISFTFKNNDIPWSICNIKSIHHIKKNSQNQPRHLTHNSHIRLLKFSLFVYFILCIFLINKYAQLSAKAVDMFSNEIYNFDASKLTQFVYVKYDKIRLLHHHVPTISQPNDRLFLANLSFFNICRIQFRPVS